MFRTLIFLFCLMFTTHAFAKSNAYYQQTLAHILTECNSGCKKKIFKQEAKSAFFALVDASLSQARFKLSQLQKKSLWD